MPGSAERRSVRIFRTMAESSMMRTLMRRSGMWAGAASGRCFDEIVHRLQLVEGLDHITRKFVRLEPENLERLRASAQGEGVVSVTITHEVRNHVPHVNVGRQFLVRFRRCGLMMRRHRGDNVGWKLPSG